MSGLVMYPCSLGSTDRFAKLFLPSDLSAADVARITAMLATLPLGSAPVPLSEASGPNGQERSAEETRIRSEVFSLIEQEALKRAEASRFAAHQASEGSSTQLGFSAESYACHSLADFCRQQRERT